MATITRREADGIILLTFDQPERSTNVLSTSVWKELQHHLNEIATEPPLRGVILTSAKPNHFSAGLDFAELLPLIGNEHAVANYMTLGSKVLRQLEELPCATVAVINGVCLGAGMELALACDYRVVAITPELKLGFPEISLGLIPGWGGTQRLSRLIGVEEAFHRLLTGLPYTEEDLPNEYLVDELCAPEELFNIAAQLVDVGEGESIRQIKADPVEQELLPAKEYLAETREMLGTIEPELLPAGLELVRVVMEGSLKTLNDALKIESTSFAKLLGSETAQIRLQRFVDAQAK